LEVCAGFAVSGSEAAELFEAVEAAFDSVALFVPFPVMNALYLSVPARGDDGFGTEALHLGQDGRAVIALVSQHRLGGSAFEQMQGFGIFGSLARGDAERHRQACFICQQVDL